MTKISVTTTMASSTGQTCDTAETFCDGDIEYKTMLSVDRDAVLELVKCNGKEFGLFSSNGFSPFLARWVQSIPLFIDDGLSVVAFDTRSKKCVGYQMALIINRDQRLNKKDTDLSDDAVRSTRSRESLLVRFNGIDLFEMYSVNRIANLRGLYVQGRYRNRGIATKLRKICLDQCRAKGVNFVVGHSNLNSKRLFEKMDFQKVEQFPEKNNPYTGDAISFFKRL